MSNLSPFAPASLPELPPISGVRLAARACDIRYKGRTDVLFVELAPETTVAGVFTRSKTCSAPVDWCRAVVTVGQGRALVVNSGNANAFTGTVGVTAVRNTAAAAAAVLGCAPEEILIASTGTIGVSLDESRITTALPALHAQASEYAWSEAAQAIMTTDTYPKAATRRAMIDNAQVKLNGIAKGSGMIAPDMATMLGFVFTDAVIAAPVLRELLTAGIEKTFNCITVDGDTSTSDTLLLFATGTADHAPITMVTDPRLAGFRTRLNEILLDLAHQVVKDGEGIAHFVTITVSGATSFSAARKIGLAIANSPLVKTAIAGGDANWGRIVMAVGKAGEKADRDRLRIRIGGVMVTENGGPVAGYDETPVTAHMQGRHIVIEVDVGVGRGKATVWTCDLTHSYIDINGSYRT
ncbi:MAG: glutamate N-acetyltransferase / amino-acid N-acetyltransferase [Rhodospirillaceae bacterium]|nr:MAG: glutamate N-acetyltransferase / amino-acid N-acetyltransferase [Rhodospirillaceae bacterium]